MNDNIYHPFSDEIPGLLQSHIDHYPRSGNIDTEKVGENLEENILIGGVNK